VFFVIIILGDDMEDSKRRKNDIFYLLLLFFTLITMIIGITFTYFSLLTKEDDDSTKVQTGTLAINYIDGQEINTYALLPISEPNLNTKYSTYKKSFSISSSNSTLDQNFSIYIDVTNNEFDNNALGFILYDANGNRISSGNIPSSEKVLLASNLELKTGENKSYTVLIWLQDNGKNQDYEQGKNFSGEFYITTEQIKYE
jgi:hypothetical protein